MNQLHVLNISKNNMDKFIQVFDKNDYNDIVLNITSNILFIDVFATLLYMQYNHSLVNKIIVAPVISNDKSCMIINDEFCRKAGLQDSDFDREIDAFDFFQKYNNTFFYLKTSGSTGEPILIKKYIYQMINEAECLKEFLCFQHENKSVCSIVPHHHMYGLTFAVFLPIISNFPIIEYSPVLENLSQFTENILVTSPEFLKKLILYDNEITTKKIKNIELIITAGSVLDEKIRNLLKNITDAKVLNIYGSTETGIIASDLGDGFRLFKSVKILNYDGINELTSNWSDKYILNDEIKVTDDRLEIYGRSDRVVKIADKRFSLDMVEKYVKQSDLIYDAYGYVINNRIGVLISLTENGRTTFRNTGKKGIVEDIEKYTQNMFGTNIRHYKIVSHIYRNSNGKLIKKENDILISAKNHIKFKQENIEKKQDSMYALFSALISDDIFYLPAHFYNFPLIPGFIELDHIIKLAEKFGYDYTKINKITNLKFSNFIRPYDKIIVGLIMSDNLVKFIINVNSAKAASGSIKYEE